MIGGRSAEDGGRWERYLEAERRVMEERGQGWLARALGAPLRGESPEELRLMAREDERRAEEGLVELLEGGELSCKRLEELAPRTCRPGSKPRTRGPHGSWSARRRGQPNNSRTSATGGHPVVERPSV